MEERAGLTTRSVLAGRYRLEAEVGRGGMGIVYRARDTVLDRDVAVKVLNSTGMGTQGRNRLLTEARAAAQLNHPNIVSVYDAGEDNDTPFIVMELVDGESLHESRPQDLSRIVAIASQICAALDHAHKHGIIHRDLKPENVLLAGSPDGGNDGPVKLMDFGLARTVASRLTTEGTVVGTVFYIAPEQALGQVVDGRADLYALGVVLYELVTGRLPFIGDDPLTIISQHLHAPPVPPRSYRSDLSPALEIIILRLLAKRSEERYASANDVALALREVEPSASALGSVQEGTTPLLELLSSGRLIGRRAELEQLLGLWSYARQGQGHLVLLSGEPGVGKTRLAREMMVYAQLHGAAVLQGGCYEYEMAVPYLPFVEAVRGWVHAQGTESLRAHLGGNASELARLAPEIETRLGPLPLNPSLSVEEERLRLFDHVTRFFQRLAAECSLLVVLDDLHWADQGSLALLRYLLRALRGDRVLILGAYREVELDRRHPLANMLVEWNRDRLATRLPIGRLGFDATAELLAALFGAAQVTHEFAAAIFRETEGNPFFLEEVVKALVEQGQIYREHGQWQRLDIPELTIPQSVKEAIGRRLDRLSPACLETLHMAAPLGKSFPFAELAAVTVSDEEVLLDALDEAVAAQLLRAEGNERFVFTHDKIREVLYEELNPVRRRRLHQRIGETLEGLYGSHIEPHVQDLAYHFVQGGDQARGLRYLRQAAEHAARLYANDEALNYYEQARELADTLKRPEDLAAIHEAMGALYASGGPTRTAVEHYQHAVAFTSSVAGRARLKAQIGSVYASVGDHRGVDVLESAIQDLNPLTQPSELALATAALGRFHHYRGQHEQAIGYLERARRLAEPHHDAATLADIYTYLAGAYQHLARLEESMHWAWQSVALGEREDYPRATSLGYEFLAEDSFSLGRWQEALDFAGRDREIGERIGAQDRMGWAEFCRASTLHGLGQLAGSAGAAQAALALAESTGDLRLAVLALSSLAIALADLNDDEAARSQAALALRRGNELDQLYMLCVSRHAMAYLHGRRQEWAPAVALYQECLAYIAQTDNRLTWLQIGAFAVEAIWAQGRVVEARRLLGDYFSTAREAGAWHCIALGQRVEGQILASLGEHGQALRALDEAVIALEALASRLELGRALYHRAQVRHTTGDAEGAEQDLRQALAAFETCGAVRDRDRAADLLRTRGWVSPA